MQEEPRIRPMEEGEALGISSLVMDIFSRFVAPLHPPEGIREFEAYVRPSAILQRNREGHVTLVAEQNGRVVGVIHVRAGTHVCLLFVEPSCQRQGIARELLASAVRMRRVRGPVRMTVNASPNSVPAYRRLGFSETGLEEVVNGIRFTPMSLDLDKD